MTTTKPTTVELLTVGQAADRLGVYVGDVRRWVRCEQCPSVRVGRATRIPAAWVAAELAAADVITDADEAEGR